MSERVRGFLPRVKQYSPADIERVTPAGYKLAVLYLPFIRRFTITWWVDADGKMGRAGDE